MADRDAKVCLTCDFDAIDEGHEIGHHGDHHITPVNLDEGAEREQIEKGLEAMDRVLHGHRAIGYRSPGGAAGRRERLTLRVEHERAGLRALLVPDR